MTSIKKEISHHILLAITTFIVYYPILDNKLLDFWDDQWVVMNYYTEGGYSLQNIWNIFTSFYLGQYAPFNEFLYLFLYSSFGYNAFYFHFSSLVLHIANAILVYWVLKKILSMTIYKNEHLINQLPFMTAFLFTITTVNVEVVAWMSASKILIYTFFYLLAVYSFLLYIETTFKWKYLLLTYLFFICSFLGKEQAVTFPIFILSIYYFLGYSLKNKNIWFMVIPLFLSSICLGIITMYSQLSIGGGVLSQEGTYPLWQRCVYGCYAFCEYLFKCLLPIKLSYLYPFPSTVGEKLPYWLWIYPLFIISLFSLSWKYFYKNSIYLLGIIIFTIHIVITLHIIPMARFVIVADRYAYLSSIGTALICSYFFLKIYTKSNPSRKIILKMLAVVYIFYLVIYTNYRSRSWYDTDTLKKEVRELLDTNTTKRI